MTAFTFSDDEWCAIQKCLREGARLPDAAKTELGELCRFYSQIAKGDERSREEMKPSDIKKTIKQIAELALRLAEKLEGAPIELFLAGVDPSAASALREMESRAFQAAARIQDGDTGADNRNLKHLAREIDRILNYHLGEQNRISRTDKADYKELLRLVTVKSGHEAKIGLIEAIKDVADTSGEIIGR
jgi:hypothetical protein